MRELQSEIGSSTVPASTGFWVPITTFAPEPYDLLRQIVVVIHPNETGHTAGFFDANIHASGDTEEEALRNLKSLILDTFDALSAEPPGQLGPEPKRQLAVLREFVRRTRMLTQADAPSRASVPTQFPPRRQLARAALPLHGQRLR